MSDGAAFNMVLAIVLVVALVFGTVRAGCGYLAGGVNTSDSVVLRELYITTQGDSWQDKWQLTTWAVFYILGFRSIEHLDGHGIATTRDGFLGEKRVTGLRLSYNNLVGEIPHSLARLDKLQTLYLSGNHLRGCIPAALLRVPDNDLHLLDLPFCETPPAPAPSAFSVPPSESAPCPPGEPCVALHGDRTETAVGEAIVLTFAAVNDIALPELTAQMVIAIPSGWVANSAEWTDACTALCNITLKIPTGDNRTTRIEIYPNESGDFSMRATLRWFAGEESGGKRQPTR